MRKEGIEEQRTYKQLRRHYRIEKALANRLRNANKKEREGLYTFVYDELFRRVPDHPQLTRKSSPKHQNEAVRTSMRIIRRYLLKQTCFLEVGPGDCALAFQVCKHVRQVYAVDVSETVTHNLEVPTNFKLLITDGCRIPVSANSVDFVFSNQVIEHLHPDDAYEQLRNIYKAISPGGFHLCITPNRLTGPHDISQYFDDVPTCFHLKEYTVTELQALLHKVGFSRIWILIGARGHFAKIPVTPAVLCEYLLTLLPKWLEHRIAHSRIVRRLIDITLIAEKLPSTQ